ncbi:PaaI family thioesterase [Hyphobacterium indicum]|jgi:acyl-coenzyme A thioesterase PaaI-like protein|uniref:PaaI family thioesterase n=1 Tax=Hyphobacterium indicum TaxID=2162714 RepID=UPI000D64885B|nr:PaaI family thioesterase [Hyphobacterium indicum]
MTETSTGKIELSPWLAGARQFFTEEHPLFARFHIYPLDVGEGEVTISAVLDDAFCFRPGSNEIFGGAMAIILDTVLGFSVLTRLKDLVPIATINLRTEYLAKAVSGTKIRCHAHCYSRRDSVAFVRGDITDFETGETLATALGTFMIGTRGPKYDAMATTKSQ